MIKVIPSGSFNFGAPVARLVDIYSRGVDRGWMTKRAAVLTREIAELRPESGHSYIHLISLGSQEFYGCNRNGDGFNEKRGEFELVDPKKDVPKIIKMGGGLIEFHPTFEKYGHVFKHHKNQDPKFKIGDIKCAAYNHDMHRGELIIKVPHNDEWNADLQKLASGQDIPFSMACKVATDCCSYCGNRARSRAEYCDHLLHHMTEIVKQGHQIFAINDEPGFFDMSKVIKPADRIAWSIQKVAYDITTPMGGAELAEYLQVTAPKAVLLQGGPAKFVRKLAAADKYAEIEKVIEGKAMGCDNQHLVKQLAGACPSRELETGDVDTLRNAQLGAVLQALGSAQICLSVRDFLRLVMGSKFDSASGHVPMVEGMLPGLFSRLLDSGEVENCANDSSYDGESASIPRPVRELINSLMGDHSLASGPATKRMQIMIIRGGAPRVASEPSAKLAAVSKEAETLAKEYAKYLLSFSTAGSDDPVSSRLTILRHYTRV